MAKLVDGNGSISGAFTFFAAEICFTLFKMLLMPTTYICECICNERIAACKDFRWQ